MAEATFAFDLHVLGTPPALILSQDQTLMLKFLPTTLAGDQRTLKPELALWPLLFFVVRYFSLVNHHGFRRSADRLILIGLSYARYLVFKEPTRPPLATSWPLGGTFQSY